MKSLLVMLAFPAVLSASLGGTISTVETDRVQMKSALTRIQRVDTNNGANNTTYTVHEILTPTGTTIREFYTPNGLVFGVAWDGPVQPDLRQLFGTYFEQYIRAIQAGRRDHRMRGRVAVDDGSLVVQISGRIRAITGVAYVPRLMPAGVGPEALR